MSILEVSIKNQTSILQITPASGNSAIVEITPSSSVSNIEISNSVPPGFTMQTYIHTQSTASTSWVINHNLGFKPNVTLLSAGGMQMEADVLHVSNNQVTITFLIPVTGTARLS